ncbi:MAG TPA: hypothetical protein VFW96_02025, partial [Thermomicrobiales bacterium]|nr:hypothetical protein [Thermomicrobiales bacterium]
MARQVGQWRGCGRARPLQGLGDLAVERPSLAGEQAGVDRLLGQGVPEGEALRRLFHHQLGRDEPLEERHQRPLVQPRQGAQQVEVEAPPGDGGEVEDTPRVRGEAVEAALDGGLDAAR